VTKKAFTVNGGKKNKGDHKTYRRVVKKRCAGGRGKKTRENREGREGRCSGWIVIEGSRSAH